MKQYEYYYRVYGVEQGKGIVFANSKADAKRKVKAEMDEYSSGVRYTIQGIFEVEE